MSAPHLNPRALWAQAFRQRSVWTRAARLGLSVGFLQATINQGDHWFSGAVDRTVVLKSIRLPADRLHARARDSRRDVGPPLLHLEH